MTATTRRKSSRPQPIRTWLQKPAASSATSTRISKSTKPTVTPTSSATRDYYLITCSRDHALSAQSQHIVQANHGIKAPMARLQPGDGVVFYSPTHALHAKPRQPCQRFTAMATVGEGEPFQEPVTETFRPWRRKAVFEQKVREVDVKDVLGDLECLKRGECGWGWVLRKGVLKMGEADWLVLRKAMVGQGR